MKKLMRKACAWILATLMLCMGVSLGAFAEEAVVEEILELGDSQPIISIQSDSVVIETQEGGSSSGGGYDDGYEEPSYEEVVQHEEPQYVESVIHRVTFYDWYGNELGWAEVPDGGYVIEPDGAPYMEGFLFNYWFDAMSDGIIPYVFGSAVTCDMSLIPYFTAKPEPAPTVDYVEEISSYYPAETVEIANALVQEMAQEHFSETNEIVEYLERPKPENAVVERPMPEHLVEEAESIITPSEPEPAPVQDANQLIESIMNNNNAEPEPVETLVEPEQSYVEPEPEYVEPEQPVVQEPVIEPDVPETPAATEAPPVHLEQTAMSQEQANTLIDEIMSGVNVWNPVEPEVTNTTEEPEAPAEAVEQGGESTEVPVVELEPTEEPQGVTGGVEERPSDVAMTDSMANMLIDEILGGMELAPVELEGGQPVEATETTDNAAPETLDDGAPAEAISAGEDNVDAADESAQEQGADAVASQQTLLDMNPHVSVTYEYDGELSIGTQVTAVAHLHNIPEQYAVHFQWQNDASGSFADVPGATGQSYTFEVGAYSANGCNWRVNVTISDS